ncbi:MAG: ABC transporter substrate-binding protein [Gammaproteobacteria bacterium]|nr:ABC transporter substrate-binding protein [Gammaproteobacteria bacterium]
MITRLSVTGGASVTGYLVASFLTAVLLLLLPGSAPAGEPQGPERVVERVSTEMLRVLENQRERLKTDPGYVYQLADEILLPHVDFERVSSLVLGKHWRSATPVQRQEFIHQFRKLLVRSYATALNELGAWEMRVIPSALKSGAKLATVRAQLIRSQVAPVDLLYSMILRDGKWMAYDVRIDGISLVTNYRSSFSKEVRLLGIAGLIEKITVLNDSRVTNNESS